MMDIMIFDELECPNWCDTYKVAYTYWFAVGLYEMTRSIDQNSNKTAEAIRLAAREWLVLCVYWNA